MKWDEANTLWDGLYDIIKNMAKASAKSAKAMKNGMTLTVETGEMSYFYDADSSAYTSDMVNLVRFPAASEVLFLLSEEDNINSDDIGTVMGAYWYWARVQRELFQDTINNFGHDFYRLSDHSPKTTEKFLQPYMDLADNYVDASHNLLEQAQKLDERLTTV